MSSGSFVVPDSLFDLLTDVPHLGLIFSVHVFRLSMKAEDLLVFAVDRFFFACCSHSREMLKHRRRRMLLLNFYCHICCCCRRSHCILLPKYFPIPRLLLPS